MFIEGVGGMRVAQSVSSISYRKNSISEGMVSGNGHHAFFTSGLPMTIQSTIDHMSFPQAMRVRIQADLPRRIGNPSSSERSRTRRNDKLHGTYVVIYKIRRSE
jgi:hypothetical protein